MRYLPSFFSLSVRPVGEDFFHPVSEQIKVGALEDVLEHIFVFFVVLCHFVGVRKGHDRIGVAFKPPYLALGLLPESDVGDEVQVGRDA